MESSPEFYSLPPLARKPASYQPDIKHEPEDSFIPKFLSASAVLPVPVVVV